MNNETKPCPFCGTNDVKYESDWDGMSYFAYCWCGDCGAESGKVSISKTSYKKVTWNNKALKEWNKREGINNDEKKQKEKN